jgi:hypothetical protein
MNFPDDMLFYFSTTEGKTHYFSVYCSVKANSVSVVEFDEDEFWSLVKDGNLQVKEVSPADFPYTEYLLPSISGNVKVFLFYPD